MLTAQDLVVFRQWLAELLLTNTVTVEFTKETGETRIMQATLRPDVLPAGKITETQDKKINHDVCVVWDTEKSAWRSFRYDRVHSIQVKLD